MRPEKHTTSTKPCLLLLVLCIVQAIGCQSSDLSRDKAKELLQSGSFSAPGIVLFHFNAGDVTNGVNVGYWRRARSVFEPLVSGYKSNRINWLSETPWSCSKSAA